MFRQMQESETIPLDQIPASDPKYPTKIILEQGFEYSFEPALPVGLFDSQIPVTTLDGFTSSDVQSKQLIENDLIAYATSVGMKAVENMRKSEGNNWFALIGVLEEPETGQEYEFFIGQGPLVLIPPFTGNLYCFLNDLPITYFNNKGFYQLKVTKLSTRVSEVSL